MRASLRLSNSVEGTTDTIADVSGRVARAGTGAAAREAGAHAAYPVEVAAEEGLRVACTPARTNTQNGEEHGSANQSTHLSRPFQLTTTIE